MKFDWKKCGVGAPKLRFVCEEENKDNGVTRIYASEKCVLREENSSHDIWAGHLEKQEVCRPGRPPKVKYIFRCERNNEKEYLYVEIDDLKQYEWTEFFRQWERVAKWGH